MPRNTIALVLFYAFLSPTIKGIVNNGPLGSVNLASDSSTQNGSHALTYPSSHWTRREQHDALTWIRSRAASQDGDAKLWSHFDSMERMLGREMERMAAAGEATPREFSYRTKYHEESSPYLPPTVRRKLQPLLRSARRTSQLLHRARELWNGAVLSFASTSAQTIRQARTDRRSTLLLSDLLSHDALVEATRQVLLGSGLAKELARQRNHAPSAKVQPLTSNHQLHPDLAVARVYLGLREAADGVPVLDSVESAADPAPSSADASKAPGSAGASMSLRKEIRYHASRRLQRRAAEVLRSHVEILSDLGGGTAMGPAQANCTAGSTTTHCSPGGFYSRRSLNYLTQPRRSAGMASPGNTDAAWDTLVQWCSKSTTSAAAAADPAPSGIARACDFVLALHALRRRLPAATYTQHIDSSTGLYRWTGPPSVSEPSVSAYALPPGLFDNSFGAAQVGNTIAQSIDMPSSDEDAVCIKIAAANAFVGKMRRISAIADSAACCVVDAVRQAVGTPNFDFSNLSSYEMAAFLMRAVIDAQNGVDDAGYSMTLDDCMAATARTLHKLHGEVSSTPFRFPADRHVRCAGHVRGAIASTFAVSTPKSGAEDLHVQFGKQDAAIGGSGNDDSMGRLLRKEWWVGDPQAILTHRDLTRYNMPRWQPPIPSLEELGLERSSQSRDHKQRPITCVRAATSGGDGPVIDTNSIRLSMDHIKIHPLDPHSEWRLQMSARGEDLQLHASPRAIRKEEQVDAMPAPSGSTDSVQVVEKHTPTIRALVVLLSHDLVSRSHWAKRVVQSLSTTAETFSRRHGVAVALDIRVAAGASLSDTSLCSNASIGTNRQGHKQARCDYAWRSASCWGSKAANSSQALGIYTEFVEDAWGRCQYNSNDTLPTSARSAQEAGAHLVCWAARQPFWDRARSSKGISLSLAIAPAPASLGVSFPWYVRSQYVVAAASSSLQHETSTAGSADTRAVDYDVIAMYEEDHLLRFEHLLHVLGRVHADWVRPELAAWMDTTADGQSWNRPRLPRLMVPGLLQYEKLNPYLEASYATRQKERRLVNGCPELNDGWPIYRQREGCITEMNYNYKNPWSGTGNLPKRLQDRGCGPDVLLHAPVNVHQAGFILPSYMLRYMASHAGCMSPIPWRARHWAYPPIELAEGEPYFACGFTKVVDAGWSRPGSPGYGAGTVWHMPNKYVGKHAYQSAVLGSLHRSLTTVLDGNSASKGVLYTLSAVPAGFVEYDLRPADILEMPGGEHSGSIDAEVGENKLSIL